MITRHKTTASFSIICNTILRDDTISLKAKGLYSYIMTLPDDWKIYMSEVIKHSSDGKDSHRTALSELITAGYVIRSRQRNDDGTLGDSNYDIYETPVLKADSPKSGKPYVGEPATTKHLPIPKTNSTNVLDKSNTVSDSGAHSQELENCPAEEPPEEEVAPQDNRSTAEKLTDQFFALAKVCNSGAKRLNPLQLKRQIIAMIKDDVPIADIAKSIAYLFSKTNFDQGQYMIKVFKASQFDAEKVTRLMMKVDDLGASAPPSKAKNGVEGAGKRI